MAEQREPGWYWTRRRDAENWEAAYFHNGKWQVIGESGFTKFLIEDVGPRILPPSAAPQPQHGVETIVVSADEFDRVLAVMNEPAEPSEAAIRGAEMLRSLPTPSQPQQQDLIAETVLHAEPGQPSNPAVERLAPEIIEAIARSVDEFETGRNWFDLLPEEMDYRRRRAQAVWTATARILAWAPSLVSPDAEAMAAGKSLIGHLVILCGMGIHADRLEEAELAAATALTAHAAREVEREREACAQEAEQRTGKPPHLQDDPYVCGASHNAEATARAIRARSVQGKGWK